MIIFFLELNVQPKENSKVLVRIVFYICISGYVQVVLYRIYPNLFHPSVAFLIKTSQMTGFFIKSKTGLK